LRRRYRDQITRIIDDLGNPEPPLALPQVRELLRLDLRYYSSANTTYIHDVAHRLKVAGKHLLARPTLLLDAIKKANLSAFGFPTPSVSYR
jgi:hypothetical protein